MPAVLLAHPGYRSDGPHRAILEHHGFELRLPPDGVDLSSDEEFAAALAGCEATIAGTEAYTAALLQRAPQLRVIARSGVGFDSVDTAAADARGIAVTTTPGTNEHSVAEHALAMLLAIARGFPERDRQVRRGGPWKRVAGPRLAGKTLGIVGLGRIGRALATRARGLQLNVLAYEPYPDGAFVAQWKVDLVSLQELLSRSDFVSIHVPLGEQTRGLFDRERLAMMKRGAMLVNTARGGIVNEDDLAAALRGGQLAAAALDVFETEPLPLESPLLELDNLLLSPHLAGLDAQSAHDAAVLVANTLVNLHEGRWPADCVVNLQGVTDWKW